MAHLCRLEPSEAVGRVGELKELPGHHPRFQGLQLAGCQVGAVVPYQVTLKLIRKEVQVDRHWAPHGNVPARDKGRTSLGTQLEPLSRDGVTITVSMSVN